MMMDSRRLNRIEAASIDVTLRDSVSVCTTEVWREDRLTGPDGAIYLVLDFAMEERVDHLQADLAEDEQDWRPSGRVLVEIQRLDAPGHVGQLDPVGLSTPTMKEIAGEEGSVAAWVGWTVDPCSPRRPVHLKQAPPDTKAQEFPHGEICAMCDQPAVHHDASGSPRCASHVGESPEE